MIIRTILLASLMVLVLALAPGCQTEDEKLFEKAQTLLEDRKYDDAMKKLTFMVNQYPESRLTPKAYFKLGEIEYFFFKKPELALDHFVHAAEMDRKGKIGLAAQKHIAEIYLNHIHNYELAILQYQRIIRDFKGLVDEDEFHFLVAKAYYGKRDFKQAIIEYQNMIDMFPKSKKKLEALYNIATCYFIDGQVETARNLYLDFLVQNPKSKHDYDARLSLAMVYEGLDQPEKALRVYEYLAEHYPEEKLAGGKVYMIKERLKDVQ